MTRNPNKTNFAPFTSDFKVTYSIKHLPCSDPGCLTCLTGKGHGPYWYAQYELEGETKNIFLGRKFKPLDLKGLLQKNLRAKASQPQMNSIKSTYSLKEKFKPIPTLNEFQEDLQKLKQEAKRGNIKGLYRQLSKKYHPDQYNGNRQMNRWMSEINGLFRQLSTSRSPF